MHKAPHRASRSKAMRRMARKALITVPVLTVCLAAGIAAGAATDALVPGTPHYGSSQWQQPGAGIALVGFSVGMLVFAAMRIAYVLYERRELPYRMYGTRYEPRLTRRQYLRRLGALELGLAALCCVGIWLRHRYG